MKRLGLIAAAAGAVLLFTPPQAEVRAAASSNNAETYKQLNLFGDVFELVRSDYVEDVTDETLVEGAINGMLTSLDPHSNYLNSKNFNDMKVQTRGEFGGLGIEVSMENGLVKVVSPIDDTPAANAGLKPGDLITHLDGNPVQGLTLPEAVEKMRGPVNSDINADDPPRGARAVRRQADPRDHQDPLGPLASRRQEHRLCPHHLVQRADRCRPQQRGEEPEAAGQQQAGRAGARPAQQPGRAARPGGGGVRRLSRQGRDRLDPRPPLRRRAALQCPARRHRRRVCRSRC